MDTLHCICSELIENRTDPWIGQPVDQIVDETNGLRKYYSASWRYVTCRAYRSFSLTTNMLTNNCKNIYEVSILVLPFPLVQQKKIARRYMQLWSPYTWMIPVLQPPKISPPGHFALVYNVPPGHFALLYTMFPRPPPPPPPPPPSPDNLHWGKLSPSGVKCPPPLITIYFMHLWQKAGKPFIQS